jgi:hypothetical protein
MSMAMAAPPASAESLGSVRRALVPLRIEPPHLVCLLISSVFFSAWLLVASGSLPVLAVFYFLLLSITAYYLGRIVLRPVTLPNNLTRCYPLIFLIGTLVWALMIFALHSFLPGSLRIWSLFLFGCAVVGQFAIHGRQAPPQEERAEALMGILVVLLSLVLATCWARGLLRSEQRMGDVTVFRHWRDAFDHSGIAMGMLSHEHLWRFGHKELSQTSIPVYHYGSYFPMAALASYGRLSTYEAVIAFWTPFGTFLSGLAAYVLAASLGRRSGGFWAMLALLALPDASWYGFKNGWFRYHWMQQIAPAGMYSCASAAVAVLFLLEAQRSRSRIALGFAIAFLGATLWFKAHIFAVLAPLLLIWFILCYPPCSVPWRILLLQAVGLLALLAVMVSNKYHLGPRIEPNVEYFDTYCRYVASECQPGPGKALVEGGAAAAGRTRYYLTATALVLVSTFGGLLVVLPLLTVWAWWVKKLQAADLFPWLAILIYALVLVGLDDRIVGIHPWELLHRPFVWSWFLVLVWCVAKAWMLLAEVRWLHWTSHPAVLCVSALVLLPLPWYMARDIQHGKTRWSDSNSYLPIPTGLVECGRYIAHHSPRTDIVQDSQNDGVAYAFGSQAERRSYLARPWLWAQARKPAIQDEVQHRVAMTEQLKIATTVQQIREIAAQTGIRWYLVHPDDHFPWPAAVLAAPAYRAEGFAVYDLSTVDAHKGL